MSLLLYSFVSSFQVVLCEQRCACGQVANRSPLGSLAPLKPLSPDLGGEDTSKLGDFPPPDLKITRESRILNNKRRPFWMRVVFFHNVVKIHVL